MTRQSHLQGKLAPSQRCYGPVRSRSHSLVTFIASVPTVFPRFGQNPTPNPNHCIMHSPRGKVSLSTHNSPPSTIFKTPLKTQKSNQIKPNQAMVYPPPTFLKNGGWSCAATPPACASRHYEVWPTIMVPNNQHPPPYGTPVSDPARFTSISKPLTNLR
jgi:hypothetical protein